MSKGNEFKEINRSLIANFRLKAKILGILFGIVFTLQVIGLSIFLSQTNVVTTIIPLKIAFMGPSLLLFAVISELFTFRYLKKLEGKEEDIKLGFVYIVTFVEISFPAILMFILGTAMFQNPFYKASDIVNSPLLVIFFIMIILSSLLLNPKLCLFSGVIGGIEYFLLNAYFITHSNDLNLIGFMNAGIKSLLIGVTGLLAGFVSRKIKEAIISSLQAKNDLIFHLDKRVAEKTREVTEKNVLLEEKQKEIIDSITYAQRIQRSLLPTEKQIERFIKGEKTENLN